MQQINSQVARPVPSVGRGLVRMLACLLGGGAVVGVLYVLIEEMNAFEPSARLLIPVGIGLLGLAVAAIGGLIEVLRAMSRRLGFVPVAVAVAGFIGAGLWAWIMSNGDMFV